MTPTEALRALLDVAQAVADASPDDHISDVKVRADGRLARYIQDAARAALAAPEAGTVEPVRWESSGSIWTRASVGEWLLSVHEQGNRWFWAAGGPGQYHHGVRAHLADARAAAEAAARGAK